MVEGFTVDCPVYKSRITTSEEINLLLDAEV